VVLENSAPVDGADGGFDADVAITTGELRLLLPDLIEALGGPLEEAPKAVPTATPAPAEAEAAPWD
jgi:recombination associated protein RdgC